MNDANHYATFSAGLDTTFVGKHVIYYPRLSSTMDAAREEAKHGAAEGTIILAGEQTGGRGRLKRTWFTPPGNIAVSIIVYPGLAGLPYLTMIASLAVVAAIEQAAGLEARIKWPNDVLVGGKKAGGILIESEVRDGQATFAIVGIGVNVGLRPGDIEDISATATSLAAASGREVLPRPALKHLLEEFERWYRLLPEGRPIFEAWRGRLVTLGRQVTARWGESTIEGIAETVDEGGSLYIRRSDDALVRVVAGDVTLRQEERGEIG